MKENLQRAVRIASQFKSKIPAVDDDLAFSAFLQTAQPAGQFPEV